MVCRKKCFGECSNAYMHLLHLKRFSYQLTFYLLIAVILTFDFNLIFNLITDSKARQANLFIAQNFTSGCVKVLYREDNA